MSQDMESLSSNLSSLNASATGSGRSKVMLRPGHSLMDWIRYTHSGKDLTSTGGKILEVSPRELAKHNTKNDAWIALKGKVYNITPYLDYHPGGEEELMRGAGKDATDLFNQVHQWVNAESMLQKCFVGILKKSWSLDSMKVNKAWKPMKKPKNPKTIRESTLSASPGIENENSILGSESEWQILSTSCTTNGDISVSSLSESKKFLIRVVSVRINHKELITDLTKENIFIRLNKDLKVWLNIRFPNAIKSSYEVILPNTLIVNDAIDLKFESNEESCCNFTEVDLKWMLCDRGNQNIFWPCKLMKKVAVNYNTYLFTFVLPSCVKMWIPIGYHVFLKSDIEGVEIVRSYTPVVPSLVSTEQNSLYDGSHIVLMIKIYPSGTLTPILNMCDIGESVFISSYAGSFSESLLKECDSIVMLAAGTGITPMIRVISWALSANDKKRSLLLLFFNKTDDDILWNTEFENCSKNFENFQVIHILSEPSHKWSGYAGSICDSILKELLPEKSVNNQLILVCGPLPFTNSAFRILKTFGYSEENIHAFTG